MLADIIVPQAMPYLLGVLGLLLIWQFHHMQVMAGRIESVDFWDRSGIRMFVHAAAQDGQSCPACQEAHGTVFLPSVGTKRNFSTLKSACTNPSGCRCLVIGLYGAWTEANRLVQYLRKKCKHKAFKVSEQVLGNMLGGDWERTISAAADRISIHMLEAMRLEGTDPDGALFRYRYVISEATSARDLHFVVPAYLRLSEILERTGQTAEALEAIKEFEARYSGNKTTPPFPTEAQRGQMSVRKSRLVMATSQAGTGPGTEANLAAVDGGPASPDPSQAFAS